MTLLERLEPQHSRLVAGVLTAALHLCLLALISTYSGRHDGVDDSDTPVTQLVLIKARQADHRDGVDSPQRNLIVPQIDLPESPLAENGEPPTLLIGELLAEPDTTNVAPQTEVTAATDPISTAAIDTQPTLDVPDVDKSAFMQSLARLAEDLVKTPRAQVTWAQDGKQYTATMILERAKDGTDLDRVIADVSAEHHGKQITTRVNLKRLAFSNFTQMIDRWDPMVQLHDDQIVGRMHINSPFSLLYDPQVVPQFLGKVTTAASSFSAQAIGRNSRDVDVFKGGIQTRAGKIVLPSVVQPFAGMERDAKAVIHELANDTDITFLPNGSYSWRDHETQLESKEKSVDQPLYFFGAPGTTLYVKGVISGTVLIYTPQKIVIEGNLTYAHDPRRLPDSHDCLALVSDRYVQIAYPEITGPGDLYIDGAIFAGRRFIVTSFEHRRSATLRIYGSLSAGSITASEPRYATKVEYDSRFEQQRPPGIPSTNRFAAEDWDGQWIETPALVESESF
jgi:hypothetical protein